jgi:hypothetical protein
MKRALVIPSRFGPTREEARQLANDVLAAFADTMSIYCFRKHQKVTLPTIASLAVLFLIVAWPGGGSNPSAATDFNPIYTSQTAYLVSIIAQVFVMLAGCLIVGRIGIFLARTIQMKM